MSKSLFKKFSSKARGAFGATKTTRRQRTRLGVESLESRQLFSTAIVGGDSFTQGTGAQTLSARAIIGIAPDSNPGTAALPSTQGRVYQLTGETIQVQATSPSDTFAIVFFDADHGGVLVEFAGQGLVTVSLDTTLPSFKEGISAPTPGYTNVSSQGLAAINVDGASPNSSIRITEINNSLDTDPVPALGTVPTTNGAANIRSLSFTNTPVFNSILAADARFAANSGSVGILAENTAVTSLVRIGNIDASGTAFASLAFAGNSTFANVQVYGGDLINDNGTFFQGFGGNDYQYGIEGRSGSFTNELGVQFAFNANTNIVNAAGEFPGAFITLPDSSETFKITDTTTQADVDAFFNGKTFNSNFVLDIDTTDGTSKGLVIGDGNTAFDGSLTVVLDAASAATVGSFDGGLAVARLGTVTFGAVDGSRDVDLDSAITTGFNGRIGQVAIYGDVDAGGGILGGGGIAGVLVTGDVTGATPGFGAKFETLGRFNNLSADIGPVIIDGDVALTAGATLINVANAVGGVGSLRGLTVLGGGSVAGTHNLGNIIITNESSTVPGAISITDDAPLTFPGVQVLNNPVRAGVSGGALLGAIAVKSTGAASDLTLTGYIGAANPAAAGGTASIIGSVSLVAGRDLTIGGTIGQNITGFASAGGTDGAAGATPTSGLILNAGRDISDGAGQTLFNQLTSLPSVGINAGRDINLLGRLGDAASSFGKLYFSAGRDVVSLPFTLQGTAATQRGTTDTVITAGDDVDLSHFAPGLLGGTIYNNITVTTGNVGESETVPNGGNINVGAFGIYGDQAGLITFNVDSTGANLGAITFPTQALDFTGAVKGLVVNAAGTITFQGGGNVLTGSLGVLSLGDTSNKANIVFANSAGTTAQTAFILADDGAAGTPDSIGAVTLRGFVVGSATSDFEVQAGSVGDVNISTDLTPPTAGVTKTAITEFGLLANNFRASAGDYNTYGGTGEKLGTVTAGTADLSNLTKYTIGAINITAAGAGVVNGSSVFSGRNTFFGLGGIKGATGSATATNGVTINTGGSNTRLFDTGSVNPSDAYFVAGDGDNDARGSAAAYSINGAALGDFPVNTAGTRVRVAIGDVNVTAQGSQPTNILGISSQTALSPGLVVLSAVHNPATTSVAAGPIQGNGTNAPLTAANGPQDDLDTALNNAFIEGTIGNVTLRSLTAGGPAAGSLLPVSDQTPRPINDFTPGGNYPLAVISATTAIGTVQGVATLNFPEILNGNSAVQVGVDTATPPRQLTQDSILVYLV